MISTDVLRHRHAWFAEAALADCPLAALALCAGLSLLIGAYALLSPPVMRSR